MRPATASIHGEKSLLTEAEPLVWYNIWLSQQFEQLPGAIKKHVGSLDALFQEEFTASAGHCKTLEDITTLLLSQSLVSEHNSTQTQDVARTLAFAIPGWQTMLYKPAFGVCPLQQLTIEDALDGYNG